jgi:hypothetical protein
MTPIVAFRLQEIHVRLPESRHPAGSARSNDAITWESLGKHTQVDMFSVGFSLIAARIIWRRFSDIPGTHDRG